MIVVVPDLMLIHANYVEINAGCYKGFTHTTLLCALIQPVSVLSYRPDLAHWACPISQGNRNDQGNKDESELKRPFSYHAYPLV